MMGVMEGFYCLFVYIYGFLDFLGGCIVFIGSDMVDVCWFGVIEEFLINFFSG